MNIWSNIIKFNCLSSSTAGTPRQDNNGGRLGIRAHREADPSTTAELEMQQNEAYTGQNPSATQEIDNYDYI